LTRASATGQARGASGPREPGDGLGVYVHVPFCRRRCDYCAFATYVDRDHLMADYVAALRSEIRRAVDDGRLSAARAVFFGGGTPSRLEAGDLTSVLREIPLEEGAEVTVECNPEDVDAALLGTYRDGGVTRISLGAQAVAPHVLASLGRDHAFSEVSAAARLVAAAGFHSWNLDLIYGAAAESDGDWVEAIRAVVALAPPHLSAYALSVEPGTPLAADPSRRPDDDVQARRYAIAAEILDAMGYRWEEISNWAMPGHHCVYNNLAWAGGDYLGFGSAAHSHRDGRRWWNVRRPERYLQAIGAMSSPVAGDEELSEEQRTFERLVLALRTPRGVPEWALPFEPDLEGLVCWDDGRAVLTVPGRMLASEIAMRLRPAPSAGPRALGILSR
jgi:putative oxygen-independent coproporphyrinogen III oxidase